MGFFDSLVQAFVSLDEGQRFSWALTGVILAFTGGVYVTLSRLVLHPLAKVPGPKLAALSDWYVAYWNIVKDGQFVHHLADLHSAYGEPFLPFSYNLNSLSATGPVIRVGPNKVCIILF